MRVGDRQLGYPFTEYTNSKAAIESLSGLVGGETAYAADTGEWGYYDGISGAWMWEFLKNPVETVKFSTLYASDGNEPVGSIYWSADEDTVNVVMKNEITAYVGHTLFFNVFNQSGETVSKGIPVMFAGTTGNDGRILIQKAIADGTLKSDYIMGVIADSGGIEDEEEGKVIWFGKIYGIDATGASYGETWADGDLLWLSQDTAGALTNIEPTGGQKILVAVVIHAHNSGILFIRPTWGGGGVANHNDLSGLQGGTAGEYYHLTSAQIALIGASAKFQRNLTADLTLADGESLVLSQYIDLATYAVTLSGNASLHIL